MRALVFVCVCNSLKSENEPPAHNRQGTTIEMK
uniref:Uncharacterized protein n=1 Tax=Anguilla anguilla TaxID=7936 RepID=A0A0E9VA92_ANGAN